jgi:hypothetical protein
MANLNTFVQKLSGGGARANQFEVQITGGPFGGSDLFTFLCKGAQIPAQNVGEIPVPYRGRQIYVAGDRTVDPWTVTVFNDAAWDLRGRMERWSNQVADMGNSSVGAQNPGTYYAQGLVRQLNRDGDSINTYTLYHLWPTAVDPIDLSYDANDVIEEFGVTFRYNYLHSSKGGGAL